MPERFTHSVPFMMNGQRYVQVGDAGHCCWCLVPVPENGESSARLEYLLNALNLYEACETNRLRMLAALSV